MSPARRASRGTFSPPRTSCASVPTVKATGDSAPCSTSATRPSPAPTIVPSTVTGMAATMAPRSRREERGAGRRRVAPAHGQGRGEQGGEDDGGQRARRAKHAGRPGRFRTMQVHERTLSRTGGDIRGCQMQLAARSPGTATSVPQRGDAPAAGVPAAGWDACPGRAARLLAAGRWLRGPSPRGRGAGFGSPGGGERRGRRGSGERWLGRLPEVPAGTACLERM